MAFRVDPYKIIRLILIAGFSVYFVIEAKAFVDKRNQVTNEILKDIKIRKDNFITDETEKQKTLKAQGLETIGNITETAEKKEEQKPEENVATEQNQGVAENNAQPQNTNEKVEEKKVAAIKNETTKGKAIKPRYIHAATVRTEAAAKKELARLGGNYRIKKVGNSYQIISGAITDEKTLKDMEQQAKRSGTKYIVRTAGK